MSPVIQTSAEVAERRLQRLEHRYRRAQNALTAAKALYGALGEAPDAKATQRLQAQRQVEEAQCYLNDLQAAIEQIENQLAAA